MELGKTAFCFKAVLVKLKKLKVFLSGSAVCVCLCRFVLIDPWAFYCSVTFCLASNLFLFSVSLQVMFNHDTISHYLAALCWLCYLVAFLFACFYCLVSFEEWSGDRTVSLLSFFILCLRQVNKIQSTLSSEQ